MFEDKYEILAQLGQGGFATVYKVRDKQFGNIRAMRVLNTPILDTNDKVYRNWLRECGILMRLGNGNHPNIIHYYTPMLVDGRAYVEMDFIKGQDIGQLIHSHAGVVPLDEVLRMAEQISSALAFCHHDIYQYCMDRAADALQFDSQDAQKLVIDDATRARLVEKYKVVHNDIHQGNVMRQFDGRYLLIDFGLAIQGENGVIKSSRHEHGAPEYMAPEKWDNEALLTEQSDIYSFGILMYQCLAGRVPFAFNYNASNSISEMFAVQQAHKTQKPESIKSLRQAAFEKKYPDRPYDDTYPEWLEDIIMRCLEKDPKNRYQNGKQLHEAIISAMSPSEGGNSKVIDDYMERIEMLSRELEACRSRLEIVTGSAGVVREETDSVLSGSNHTKIENPVRPVISQRIHGLGTTPTSQYPFVVNGVRFVMQFVEGGTFTMGATSEQGSDAFDDEKPTHCVTLSSYYIGQTEVTQALWKAVMGSNPSSWKGDNLPVEQVSWNDCQTFVRKLSQLTGRNFRLPTEAEWEFAARGGNYSKGYKYSGSNTLGNVAWYDDNSGDKTHIVGQKYANELGLYDMSGNVWEWCQDVYGGYSSTPQTNPDGLVSWSNRVRRGGSWCSRARYCRVSVRSYNSPASSGDYLGLRLALSE